MNKPINLKMPFLSITKQVKKNIKFFKFYILKKNKNKNKN
jgi:hypothetical protein